MNRPHDKGDLQHWTERERRVLARLGSLGAGRGEPVRSCARDAAFSVEHWTTLLPVQREGMRYRHVFEDCAHWWALARQCLAALDALHEEGVVHLRVQGRNVCIPADMAGGPGQATTLRFEQLALTDFSWALVPGESMDPPPSMTLVDRAHASPRLLEALDAAGRGDAGAMHQLDWRCDLFSLAVMLRRCLPGPEAPVHWAPWHQTQALHLIEGLLDAHDNDGLAARPHRALIALANAALADAALSASLGRGWVLVLPNAAPAPAPVPPAARRATGTPVRTGAAAVVAVLLGAAGWWVMQRARSSGDDAVNVTGPAAVTQAAATPSPEASPVRASPARVEPVAAVPAPPIASAPVVTAAAQVASAPTATPAAAPRAKAPRSRTRASLPTATTPKGEATVNEAERARVLEWLTRRGPAPRADMKLPPAPAAVSASAVPP